MTIRCERTFTLCTESVSLRRAVAVWCLVPILVLQPMLSAASGVVVAHGQTTMDQAANGIDMVNIAGPNESGLSHNFYHQFNVGPDGLILNNATAISPTELGGFIDVNPHLQGQAAGIILNEVISANPSSLQGYIEVGGQQADVVVANPYGIQCNGCGFINTSRATLTTGQPRLGVEGELLGFDVQGGTIDFLGAGINAGNIDRFDVLARSVQINAEIHANALNIIGGAHRSDYDDLSAGDITADPGAPAFAIDSSALGGIYANRIRLIGTEAGLGINLDAPVATQSGDLYLSADGQISYQRISASDNIEVIADVIESHGDATAGKVARYEARDINLVEGALEARQAVIRAETLALGEEATVAAVTGSDATPARSSTNTPVRLDVLVDQIDNAGALVSEGDGRIQATGQLNNHGEITVAGAAHVTAGRIHNDGDLRSGDTLRVDTREFRHAGGDVEAGKQFSLSANRMIIEADAAIRLHSDADINAFLVENSGVLTSAGNMHVNAEVLQNHGDIAAMGGLRYRGDTLINSRQALLFSAGPMQLSLRVLENLGTVYAIGNLDIAGNAGQSAGQVRNISGLLASDRNISIHARHIENIRAENPELVIELIQHLPQWPTDYDEECFNRNKRDECGKSTSRLTYEREEVISYVLPAEAGRILAGGDLFFVADTVLNSISRIAAVGDIGMEARQVTNETFDVELREHVRTDYSWRVRRKNSAAGTRSRKYTYTTMPYAEDPAFCSGGTNRCEKGPPGINDDNIIIETVVGSQIEAGGEINIAATDRFGNGSDIEGAEVRFGNTLSAIYGENGEHAPDTLFRLAPLDPGVFRLPGQTGLFVLASAPDHPYLIETNPLLADYMRFLGTPYMLQRLGWDPDGGLRLLGDGFYELTLVMQALADAGEGVTELDREAQQALFAELMENALYAAEGMELVPGVALSADQIGQLQQDIVWLEQQNIGGHEVLVPVVYLANGADPARAGGALLAGSDVNVSAGTLHNRGTIQAHNNLDLTAQIGDLSNRGDLLAGNGMTLSAAGDIRHEGGLLHAAEMTLRAMGNINVSTQQLTYGDEENWITALGQQARVQAGSLQAYSGADIVLDGALIEGDDILLDAEGSIRMGAVEAGFGAGLDRKNVAHRDEAVRLITTEILGNASVLLRAGDDLLATAANLASGGDLALSAGGDIHFDTAHERDYRYRFQRREQSFGRESVSMDEGESNRVVGSLINAGGDVQITSGGDMHLTSVDITAGKDMLLGAGGTLLIDTDVSTYQDRAHSSRTGYTTSRASGYTRSSLEHEGNTLEAGGNLVIMALNDATLVNADLSAGQDLMLSAGIFVDDNGVTQINPDASLSLLDAHDSEYFDSYSERSRRDLAGIATSLVAAGMGMGSIIFNPIAGTRQLRDNVDAGLSARRGRTEASGYETHTSQGSSVTAEGNLLLQSAADMLIVGSEVQGLRENEEGIYRADVGTTLLAGSLIDPRTGRLTQVNDDADVRIAAGVNRHDSYHEKERYRTDYLGVLGSSMAQSFATISSAVTGDFSGPAALPSDMGTRREGSEYRLETVTLTESVIHDDNHLNIGATGDITTVASRLFSGGDMALAAGGDVNLNAGLETLSEFQAQYHSQFDSFTAGYDRGRLYAGIEGQNYREETLLEQGTALGSSLYAEGLLTLDVGGDVNIIGSDVTAYALVGDIGGTLNIAAAEEYERTTHQTIDETVSLTMGLGNSYLDAYYAADDLVKASEDVKRAYDALKAARDDPRVSASDLSNYEANLALALLQQQAVGLQAATSMAGAVENAPVAGFHGDVQLATETTHHTEIRTAETHHGSTVSVGEGGMMLQGEGLRVAGSELNVAGDMYLGVEHFTVEAVEDRYTHQTRTETKNGTLTVASSSRSKLSGELAKDAVLSAGLGESSSTYSSESGSWQQSDVNVAGVLQLDVSGDTTIRGGAVGAGAITGQTGTLTVASVQDTTSTRHSSKGMNLGGGQGFSINGGYNTASGSSDRAWVEQVSGLYGGGGLMLTVDGHTQLDGAYIASGNAEYFVLDTGTFAYTDIEDHDHGSNSGWGFNSSLNPLDMADKQRAPQGSTTLSMQSAGHDKLGITRATLGEGTLIVREEDSEHNRDLADLNRDILDIQDITRDRVTGGLDFSLTVDHRFLDKKMGWPEIARDVATAVGLPVDVARSVMDILGERGILELGTLVHEYGLTRKQIQNIKRLPRYEEMRAILAGHADIAEEDVAPLLLSLLGEIGSVAPGDPEELARAQALFAEVGEQGQELGAQDGDAIKVALHGRVGQALAGADGANAAAANELLMPLLVELAGGSPERLRALSRIVGGISSEDAATGARVAEYGTTYNRQMHQGELVAIRDNARVYAEEHGLTESEALTQLLLEGLRQIDGNYAEHIGSNPEAAAFIHQLAADNPYMQAVSSSGHQGGLFDTSEADYWDSEVNAFHLWDMENLNGYPVRDALLDGGALWMVNSEALNDVYRPVFDAAGDYAASQQLNQLWIPVMGLATPVVVSGGTAAYGYATTQGQFWSGVASQAGTRWMQSTGAAGQVNLWAAGNATRYGAAEANKYAAYMLHGTGKGVTRYTMGTGTLGFFTGLSGGMPGTQPAYIPDGMPTYLPAVPFNTGAAVGQGVHDLFLSPPPNKKGVEE